MIYLTAFDSAFPVIPLMYSSTPTNRIKPTHTPCLISPRPMTTSCSHFFKYDAKRKFLRTKCGARGSGGRREVRKVYAQREIIRFWSREGRHLGEIPTFAERGNESESHEREPTEPNSTETYRNEPKQTGPNRTNQQDPTRPDLTGPAQPSPTNAHAIKSNKNPT